MISKNQILEKILVFLGEGGEEIALNAIEHKFQTPIHNFLYAC